MPNHLTFAAEGVKIYVTIGTVISLRVKVISYFMFKDVTFYERKLTRYYIAVYVIRSSE